MQYLQVSTWGQHMQHLSQDFSADLGAGGGVPHQQPPAEMECAGAWVSGLFREPNTLSGRGFRGRVGTGHTSGLAAGGEGWVGWQRPSVTLWVSVLKPSQVRHH